MYFFGCLPKWYDYINEPTLADAIMAGSWLTPVALN